MICRSIITSIFVCAIVACSSESPLAQDRTSTTDSPVDAGLDASGDALAPAVADPNDGRDSNPASCFAACSNTAFSCQAESVVSTVDVVPDATGCSGTLTHDKGTASETVTSLKLDCGARKVCTGAAGQPATDCVDATFSALSFGYARSSGGPNVCTRE